jgi:hypothetical protein
MSTDNSVEIAKLLGCHVIRWKSNGINDIKYINIKNTCWKHIKNGWVICADMDEWLCITHDELYDEYLNGTTIIKIKGINIVGDSKFASLSDINLHTLNKGINYPLENKKLCFFVPKIKYIKYSMGSHTAKFTGDIKYSNKTYINKHMECLGLKYYLNKKKNRNARALIKKSDNLQISLTNFYLKYIYGLYSPNMNIHKNNYLITCKKSKKIYINNDKKIIKLFMKLLMQLVL